MVHHKNKLPPLSALFKREAGEACWAQKYNLFLKPTNFSKFELLIPEWF